MKVAFCGNTCDNLNENEGKFFSEKLLRSTKFQKKFLLDTWIYGRTRSNDAAAHLLAHFPVDL